MDQPITDQKITSVEKTEGAKKVKDPKRVEAGKRLGAISKMAKERRARERFMAETRAERADQASDSGFQCVVVIGAVGVIGLLCMYGWWCTGAEKSEPVAEPRSRQPRRAPPPSPELGPTGNGNGNANGIISLDHHI